jgi:aminopeptidase YwaD
MSSRFQQELAAPRPRTGDTRVPIRNPDVKGPLGPSTPWVAEKAGTEAARLAIVRVPAGDDAAYEIVNFVDGQRTVEEIRAAVSAEFEPIETRIVAEYLDLLARLGAIRYK